MHSRKTSKSSAKDVAGSMETMKLTEDPAAASTSSTAQAPSGAPTEKPAKQDKERKDQKMASKAQKPAKPQQGGGQQGQKKKQEGPELIGITTKKSEDLSEWYQQVILKGDMLEFTDIPGCYIYQPASYRIWEFIQDFFNERK